MNSRNFNSWWVTFPIKGLSVIDTEPNIKNPIFGDTTIISSEHLKEIGLKIRNKNGEVKLGKSPVLDHEEVLEDFDSFIIVKRNARSSDDIFKTYNEAKTRAYRISSLLSLFFLSQSTDGQSCGLVEQFYRQASLGNIMFDIEHGKEAMIIDGSRGIRLSSPFQPIELTTIEIIEMLNANTNFASLVECLTASRSNSLQQTIVQSAVKLSDAVHAISPSTQLLEAVITIEMLFTINQEKYENIKRRIIALLGSDAENYYKIEDAILKLRHKYVHEGKEIDDYKMALNAIGLALSCLLRAAELSKVFLDKKQFIDYLDYVTATEKVKDFGTTSFITNSQSIGHNREVISFPFLNSSQ